MFNVLIFWILGLFNRRYPDKQQEQDEPAKDPLNRLGEDSTLNSSTPLSSMEKLEG